MSASRRCRFSVYSCCLRAASSARNACRADCTLLTQLFYLKNFKPQLFREVVVTISTCFMTHSKIVLFGAGALQLFKHLHPSLFFYPLLNQPPLLFCSLLSLPIHLLLFDISFRVVTRCSLTIEKNSFLSLTTRSLEVSFCLF